jgi:uncharacterized protein
MNRVIVGVLAMVVGSVGIVHTAFAYTSPGVSVGFVNDFAGVLSEQTESALNETLTAFSASTTNEVVVVTVPTIGDEYIEQYAVKLFEEWGIGSREEDNGILMLLAITDRQVRIEVGYGLEGAVPDSVAQRIISNDMVPLLAAGDYDAAVTQGVSAVMEATKGEYRASTSDVLPTMQHFFDIAFPLFIFGSFVLQWVGAMLARTTSWWLGGILGMVLGVGISSAMGWWALYGTLLTGGLTLFGLFFDYVVSSTYRHSQKYGVTPPWWAGGNGYSGRSSGGGGFGGFGGGRSGGGGASGRW